MKLTVLQMQNFMVSYQKIKDIKMPIFLAFDLSRVAKKIEYCLNFYKERYNACLEAYAEKDENGYKLTEDQTGVILIKETLDEAHQKFKELDEWEVDFNIKPFPISKLEGFELSPSDLIGLLPFIEEEN